jgi:threonyl-tRNA synthetase
VLPISEKFQDYARSVAAELSKKGVRIEVDERLEKIGRLIRDTELAKIPYMLVVGEKEMNDRTVAVRRHGQGDQGVVSIEAFGDMIQEEVSSRISK